MPRGRRTTVLDVVHGGPSKDILMLVCRHRAPQVVVDHGRLGSVRGSGLKGAWQSRAGSGCCGSLGCRMMNETGRVGCCCNTGKEVMGGGKMKCRFRAQVLVTHMVPTSSCVGSHRIETIDLCLFAWPRSQFLNKKQESSGDVKHWQEAESLRASTRRLQLGNDRAVLLMATNRVLILLPLKNAQLTCLPTHSRVLSS